MNIHIPHELVVKYPTYEFRGKTFILSNGNHYIRAFHKTLQGVHYYCFEEDFFWLDKDDFMPKR